MTTHSIAVVGGDGIGPEVTAVALDVIAKTGVSFTTTEYDLGAARYLRDGVVLPDEVLEEWRGHDAILLGAVGDPAPGVAAPAGLVERGILLQIFEQCCDWHPRTAKNPGTARAVRIAFDIGAGRPVNHE